MCDWLSRGEWCDVTILCGGRSFNVHRMVLASVSKFLKHSLLSCPADESPSLIVLPDFDYEAMSSVLYYIYNGEVIVKKSRLSLFLDIIQAMQIYIDRQYLPAISDIMEERNYGFNTNCDMKYFKPDIFTLRLKPDKDQRFFNVKKGLEIQSIILQHSQTDPDFQDNVVRTQNGSELCRSRLGNLKSPYGDRQRNSFLRDLYIETYPRNGNVNGLTEGVLAISNESYRTPASVLSTNANGEHLGGDAHTTFTENTTVPMSAILHLEQHHWPYPNRRYYGLDPLNFANSCRKISMDTQASINDSNTVFSNDISSRKYEEKILPSTRNSLDFGKSFIVAMEGRLLQDSKYSLLQHSAVNNTLKTSDSKSTSSTRVIFNQVLENPWNPRKPINFRPHRRKDRVPSPSILVDKAREYDIKNDDNNNIETLAPKVPENISEVPSYVTIDPGKLGSFSKGRDCFKCVHCHQVFTTSDALATHMRRHSATARYACSECSKTFSQLRNFKYHMSIHRGTKEFAATCSVCGKYFNDRGYLSSHMKIHRNRKEYKCTLCPKSFNQRVAYNMHVRIHTGVKPHVCDECGKAFSRKMLLRQHQRTHSGERPYACPHCDKRFADRSNMTLHLRLHTGVKPFSCSLCPKSFTKKHHLKSHLNFHTGSKPYSCPRCQLAFTQSSNMRTHYKKCSAPVQHSSGL